VSRAGIPTVYEDVRFRSRLEARWATFFDALGWPWEYEPVDLGGYIPDFVLPFEAGALLVECKPAFSLGELEEHTAKVERSGWPQQGLIVGAMLFGGCDPAVGLLSQRTDGGLGWTSPEEQPPDFCWEQGDLIGCRECKRPSLYSPLRGWCCYRCGAHGKIYGGPDFNFRRIWREAGNATQWRAA
jgi:hypothetical protein